MEQSSHRMNYFPARRLKRSLLPAFAALTLLWHIFVSVPVQAHAGLRLHEAQVTEVNDGDTVTLRFDGTTYRVRLIGIDAPELDQQPWGRKAKKRLIELMDHAEWTVSVETDVEKRDKYNRLLAYLWTKQNELINERMVLDGYAILFTFPPNVKYKSRFVLAEKRARAEKKDIWGVDGLKESPYQYRKKHPRADYAPGRHTHFPDKENQ